MNYTQTINQFVNIIMDDIHYMNDRIYSESESHGISENKHILLENLKEKILNYPVQNNISDIDSECILKGSASHGDTELLTLSNFDN